MNDLFPVGLSEKTFMREYERGKQIVDAGIKDYFILIDNAAFSSVRQIGNTTLKDIQSIFGPAYISFFRFAGKFNCAHDQNDRRNYQTLRIRPLNKSDKKKLRETIRFFPADCWVCEWGDAFGQALVLPFVQASDGDYFFLNDVDPYRKTRIGKPPLLKTESAPGVFLKQIIEDLPDYYCCDMARVKYKHTDIVIPLPKGTAKGTFKNREKDESGIKRRLLHEVKKHERKTVAASSDVKAHLRGTSEITINGMDVDLIGSFDFTTKYAKALLEKHLKGARKMDEEGR